MITAVIIQPSYLPWLGFFEQLWRSDVFVFYDDVQFDKNGWRNRNRIKTAQGIQWLSVPVHVALGEKINAVKIDNSTNWKKKQLRTIEIAYSKTPYFDKYFQIIETILLQDWCLLTDLNISLIKEISKVLGIERNILLSSEMNISEGGKTGRLVNICKSLGADLFYEGSKGSSYVEEDVFLKNGIRVEYQNYDHPIYKQWYGDFIPYLSIIDLLFNHGPESLIILTRKKT